MKKSKSRLRRRVEKALEKYKTKCKSKRNETLANKMGVSTTTVVKIMKDIDPVQFRVVGKINKFLDKGGF